MKLNSCYFAFFLTLIFATFVKADSSLKNHPHIAYTDVGNGKPLVLIHAFPTDKRLWELQTQVLQKHFRVIAIDLWGFGGSHHVDGRAISMETYAKEVKMLLDKLHIKQAIIGGESMGGYISLAFLANYPQQTSGLILGNTRAIPDSAEMKRKREETAKDILQNGTNGFINTFIGDALMPNAKEETKLKLKTILTSQPKEAFASALRGMAERIDYSDLLKKTKLPILIITSTHDLIVPTEQSHIMHSQAVNSKLVIIANAAHLSNLEQPEEWNRAVSEMFS